MKKLLLSALLLTSITNFAQQRENGNIEITPIIGYSSFSTIDSSPTSTVNYIALTSANFGVTGDYYFNNRWSFRSGLHFQTMGTSGIMTNLMLNSASPEDKLSYLNIPIQANWHFGSTRKWNLNYGVTPGFLLSAKESIPNKGISDQDVSAAVNSFQLGLSVGIGYKLEISKNIGLLLDLQEFVGLTDYAKAQEINRKNYGGSYNLGVVYQL